MEKFQQLMLLTAIAHGLAMRLYEKAASDEGTKMILDMFVSDVIADADTFLQKLKEMQNSTLLRQN